MRVLVVDDETFLAELVKLALEADGHVCYSAGSIAEAAEVVRSVRLDLVALDLVSGGADPLSWMEEVALEFPQLHGRIVLLTGRTLEDQEQLRVTGCGARVMPKPFTLHGLRRMVAEIGNSDVPGRASPSERSTQRPLTEDS